MKAETPGPGRRDLQVALLATAVLVAAWWPLLGQGLLPVDGNMISVGFPNWALARSLWAEPRWPLWNPLRGLGSPHLADPITSALYPPMCLFGRLGFASFLRAWVVAHTLLAAAFAGALGWRRERDAAAAAAAAAAAGINGFFLSRVMFPHQFAAQAWLPAALFFQDRRSARGLGACLALQWLGGYPPFSILTAAAAAAWAAGQGREGWRCWARGAAWALGLAACQWIPFLELLRRSSRSLVLDPASALEYSVPPAQLLKELLAPLWSWWSPSVSGDPSIVSFYLGWTGAALAALGARRRDGRLLAGLAAAGLLLSLGAHLPGYVRVAPLRVFRYPANWLFLSAGAVTVLIAGGVAALPPRWRRPAAATLVLELLGFAAATRQAWTRPGFFTDVPPLAQAALRLPRPSRLLHEETLLRAWLHGTLETAEDYEVMRDLLAPSFGEGFGVEGVGNFQTMRLRTVDEFRARLADPAQRSPLADWTGARLLVGLKPGAARVERGAVVVTENPRAKERVFVADGSGSASLVYYRAGRVAARVSLPREADVVFAESAYPGWKATIDGRPARGDVFAGVFQALRVPAGTHELRWSYSPASFWLGLLISLAALAAWGYGAKPLWNESRPIA